MSDSLEKQMLDLYKHCPHQDSFLQSSLVVMTEEGQVVVELGLPLGRDKVHQTGVLLAGAWQASLALSEENQNNEEKVLSLGSSDSGFLVLPFSYHHKLILGVVYQNDLNPGKLKMKSKLLRDFLSENLSQQVVDNNQQEKDENYLFKNITDDELDELFSFAGI